MVDMTDKWQTTLSRPMSANERVPDAGMVKVHARPKSSTTSPIRGEAVPTPTAQAHQAIFDALQRFEAAWNDISAAEQRGELTPEGRSATVADATPTDAVDQAVAQAAARAQKADADYRVARAGLSPKSGDVAGMLRADAIWRRASQELGALPPERFVAAAQRLIEGASPAELSVLAEELPSFLRSRDVSADWLDSALEAASPALKTAAAQRKLAIQAHQIVTSNARAAKRAMSSAGHGSYRRPTLADVSTYDPDS